MSNSAPDFTTGGSVFNYLAAQWKSFFAAKVDATNGSATNLSLTTPTINGLPIPMNIVTDASAPLSISNGVMSLGYNTSIFATLSNNLDLASQGANLFLAGPTSGATAKPSYRAITTADLPGSVVAAPTGAITAFGGLAAPSGWLLCNGSAVSRTTYASLFAVIGTNYGIGDGSTTFNVPDSRGRVLVGYDSGNATGRLTGAETGGVSAAALGNAGGEQGHALAPTEGYQHNHAITDPGHLHASTQNDFLEYATPGAIGFLSSATSDVPYNIANTTASQTTGISINNTAAGAAHNNVQPTLVVNCIIKT